MPREIDDDDKDLFGPEDDDSLLDDDTQDDVTTVDDDLEIDDEDTATKPGNDAASIAAAIRDGFAAAAKPAATQPSTQMSEEDMKKALKIWDPSDDEVADLQATLLDTEKPLAERKKAFIKLRDAIAGQSTAFAEMRVRMVEEKLRQEFAPVMKAAQEQKAKEMWKEFYGDFPGLKGFNKAAELVAGQMLSSGYSDAANWKKDLARNVVKHIKQFKPDFDVRSVRSQSTRGTPRPASLSGAGAGGAGGRNGSPKTGCSEIW